MIWNLAIEDDRRMLKRIVAMLFALACLAERLSVVPRPVRAFVLRILEPAEAVARDFVLGTRHPHGLSPPFPARFGARQVNDSPGDAMRLAQSFRILAVLLDKLTDRTCGGGKNSGRSELLVTPAACAMLAQLQAALRLAMRQPVPAAAQLAVERRDSS